MISDVLYLPCTSQAPCFGECCTHIVHMHVVLLKQLPFLQATMQQCSGQTPVKHLVKAESNSPQVQVDLVMASAQAQACTHRHTVLPVST